MTSQEKYPKFYSHPHYWINAIEVECINTFTRPVGLGVQDYDKGEIIKLSPHSYDWIKTPRIIERLAPKFKPQEGEAFIKDLEAAVNTGCTLRKYQFVFNDNDGALVFDTSTGYRVMVSIDNISNVCTAINGLGEKYFDTAAYVDKLRELGYYI